MSQPTLSSQPLFYSSAEPLEKERHAAFGLKRTDAPFRFAVEAYAIPLNVQEFNLALKSYPIIFTSTTEPKAIAAVGIQKDRNLFVNEDGTWLEGAYIPAYVRRYPFIFAQMEGQDQFALCVDMQSDLVSETPDIHFFENGELSEPGRRAVEFCQFFHEHSLMTEKIMAALGASGLLANRDLTFKNEDGSDQRVGSYIAVDEQKLATLSDEAFLDLRRKEVLPLIYMHLCSLSNWKRLLELHLRRHGQGQARGGPESGTAENGPAPAVS